MSVAKHLKVTPEEYDVRIRTLIPLYDDLLSEAASALQIAARKIGLIVDLGIGTGALAEACLRVVPQARVWGIDADANMMRMVAERLGALQSRVELTHANFVITKLPECDAMVASYSLHHIRELAAKQAFYRRCFSALRPGGVLVIGDCAPSSTPQAFARDLEVWYSHLGKTFGRAKGKKVYESWANRDVYFPLAEEVQMLERAGFTVELPWRRSPLAVIAAIKVIR